MASALALIPYVLFNLKEIVSAEGSIVHMSPGEWAIFTAISSFVLWVASTAILLVSDVVTGNQAWLFVPLAVLAFAGIALAFLGGRWRLIFELSELAFSVWIFWQGLLSIVAVFVLAWLERPKVA